jgi:hypothetical protein
MEIDELTDDQAVRAVHLLAARFLEADGVTAQVVLQEVRKRVAKERVELPYWATAGMRVNKASGVMCRTLLEAVIAGKDKKSREWARGAIARAIQPAGQAIDPITGALVGTFLIALVLAALRVKRIKVGGAEIDFYEGVPKETADIIEKAAKVVIPLPEK